MQLSVGSRLGPYEVTGFVAQGGMGEVYRGIDTRLTRPVAIKVSGRAFTDRFEREAHAIASLNHPNICTLYDVGPNYLVMEFVEGEPLSEVIARGPIALDKALTYAIQIVDALAAAHAKGVVHRDLKPGNILLSTNGIKILDFGLAKLTSDLRRADAAAASVAVTGADPITSAGSILGTLHYMSPEQVEGKDTDERADIFSVGAVIYEMITGQRAFSGDTHASVLAAILKDQPPPMAERQPRMPRALERIVRRCLEKAPDDRWQSARDLKPALELVDLDAPQSTSGSSIQPVGSTSRRRGWLWPALAAAVIAATAVAIFVLWPSARPAPRVTRFEVPFPQGVMTDPLSFYVRVSPDGSKLAFTTVGEKGGIWLRDLESLEARLLPGTQNGVAPFWSPDSRSLAFGAGNKLMRVDTSGGPPQVLAESQYTPGSGFWTPDGQIVFGPRGPGPLMRVPASGGVPVPVTELAEGEAAHNLPSLLPDSRHFLYRRVSASESAVFGGSLDAKPGEQSREPITPAQFGVTFVPGSNGSLFFVREDTLMAQPFDARAMRLAGEPVPVVQQIGKGPQHAFFSATAGGVMAYRTGPGNNTQLSWIDRNGTTLEKIGDPSQPAAISLSPDEKQVAIVRSDTPNVIGSILRSGDIWLLDLGRNIETRLTTGQSVNIAADLGAIWSPDGKQLAYAAGTRIFVRDVGGATDARLVKDVGDIVIVTDWTRDGRSLIVTEAGPGGRRDIRALAVETGESTLVVANDGGDTVAGRISPDGLWLAYASNRSGRYQVYVRPFRLSVGDSVRQDSVTQISSARVDSIEPKWSADGKQLFFVNVPGVLMSADIETGPGLLRPAAPVQLPFDVRYDVWDVSRSPQRFLVAAPLDRGSQTPITVVTNWEATLRRQ